MDVQWVLIGEVGSSQGNKGEVRVNALTEFPQRFAQMEAVYLFRQGDEKPWKHLPVESCRFHKSFVILKLAGVDGIDDAVGLKGLSIKVKADDVVPLPHGRHYIFELIGLSVVTTDGLLLGTVSDVLQPGANDVYVVRPASNGVSQADILIPVIDDVVLDIDLAKGEILVKLLDGLLE